MKKLVSIILVTIMLVSTIACGKETNSLKDPESSTKNNVEDINQQKEEVNTAADESLTSPENIDEAKLEETFTKLIENAEPGCYDVDGNLIHKLGECDTMILQHEVPGSKGHTLLSANKNCYSMYGEGHKEAIILVFPDDIDNTMGNFPEEVVGAIGRNVVAFNSEPTENLRKVHVSDECFITSSDIYKTKWYQDQNATEDIIKLGSVLLKYPCTEETFVIPEGIRGIVTNFDQQNTIESTKLLCPSSLIIIGAAAFNDTNIVEYELNEGLKSLGMNAVNKNTVSINMPNSLEEVGATYLSSYDTTGDGTCIIDGVMLNVAAKETIVIPEGIRLVAPSLIDSRYHENVKHIIVESNDLKVIPANFCRAVPTLESVKISDNVEQICGSSFMSCKNLKEVTLGNNIKRVENGAFSGCSITEVYIPDSIEYMHTYSFDKTASVSIPKHAEELVLWYDKLPENFIIRK